MSGTVRRWVRPFVIICSACAVLAACSSDSSATPATSEPPAETSAGAETAATAGPPADLAELIATTLMDVDAADSLDFTQEEADCLAGKVVGDIGEPRLIELGADNGDDLTSLEWTTDERDQVFSSIQSCVDVHAQLVAVFNSDGSLTPAVADCIATAYETSDVLPDALFSTAPDAALDARVDATLNEAFTSCS